jgi:hypothetical protein
MLETVQLHPNASFALDIADKAIAVLQVPQR